MSNEPICMQDLEKMAVAACKSGLFAMPSPEAALTLMLLCQAEGLHPIQALRQYHIIKGRPAMRADAMQAAFQNAGGKIQWHERNDEKASATFSHPAGGDLTVTWTIEQAKKAGLTNNPTWQKFPRAMLSARVTSEGCRAVYPAVVCGLYEPSEIMDFDESEAKQPKAKKPSNSTEAAQISTPTNGKVVEPAKAEINAPGVTVEPKKTMYQKAKESKPEFNPDDVSDADVVEPIKAAARPEKAEANSAKAIADQLREIRNLAIAAGAASQDEIRGLISSTIGRKISSATDMNATERAQAVDALKHMQGGYNG